MPEMPAQQAHRPGANSREEMKKNITKEVHFCDKCEKESSTEACLGCGVELCYDCQKAHGKNYQHAVNFRGSGDGFYCNACDASFTAAGTNRRHNAYREIKSLRFEMESWNEDFKKRKEAAEEELKEAQR